MDLIKVIGLTSAVNDARTGTVREKFVIAYVEHSRFSSREYAVFDLTFSGMRMLNFVGLVRPAHRVCPNLAIIMGGR